MTPEDTEYVRRVLQAGLIQSPCLELGVGYDQGPTCRDMLIDSGIKYVGTDMLPGPTVDFVIDMQDDWNNVSQALAGSGEFGSALVLNVLEHSFEPLRILDNVLRAIRPGGTCIIVTPAVWPLHTYPFDCYRLLPNFYEEYSRRRSVELLDDFFEYVGKGNVRANQGGGEYVFPRPGRSERHLLLSRIVHKLLNTTGRGMFFPSHIAVGAVLRKPA